MSARILVVDDVPANVRLLEARLSAEYFSVVTASCGAEALEICERAECDIVLLDVMMPGGLDGYQVCEEIKMDPDLRNTMIILLTARGQRTDIERGQSVGCDAYLVKPFSPIELLDTVDRLVTR